MAYFLLTGATGLLGRYLLRDLTLANVPLAVLVRPSRWETAAQRIETALARWEQDLGHALARPVVLQGDIAEPELGLSADDLQWLCANTEAVIHSAAALTFESESMADEPWRTNIEGTRNVLEMCRRAGIRQYHHVSTAYVCGTRRGRILESEGDLGQTVSNDYEKSKLIAEQEVAACDLFDRVTVYRPSIIVGDSRTGYTTTFHGLYTPVRLIHALIQRVAWEKIVQNDWLGGLQLQGDERKNFVAVDWVSAAMTWLITHPEHHGKTYHLTNPAPTTSISIQEALVESLIECVQQGLRQTSGGGNDDEKIAAGFREQMKIYQTYWQDDPEFDSTNTQAAAPHLPCPVIDHEVMRRLIHYAIQSKFGWPREALRVPAHDFGEWLSHWLAAGRQLEPSNGQRRYVNLNVSGPGGGQWHLIVDSDRLVAAGRGTGPEPATNCYLTSETLRRLAQEDLSTEDSISAGRLVVAGRSVQPLELPPLWRGLGSSEEHHFV